MFKREIGALVDVRGFLWDIIIDGPASLLYSDEKIWQMGKFVPKIILAHTHPPGMLEMSHEDLTTLKAWSYALPNRVEMQIITRSNMQTKVMRYMFMMEDFKSWVKRGKAGEREMKLKSWPDILLFRRPWVNRLMELSYD